MFFIRKFDTGTPFVAAEGARAARGPIHPAGSWMRREQVVMGTAVAVHLWADDRTRGMAAMASVVAEMHRVERAFNARRPDSELALANAAAFDAPVRVSEELYMLLRRAVELMRLTGGAFDIVRGNAAHPAAVDAGADADAPPWAAIELDAATRSLRLKGAASLVELGGIADAHAVDRCCAMLARQGVRHAIVRAGAATRTVGDRRGKPWQVAVPDAQRAGGVAALLPAEDAAVASCEDHRLALAATAPTHLRSATVVARDAVTAAALAEALYVRGSAGIAIVAAVPGAAAVVVDHEGTLHATRGLHLAPPAHDN